MSVNVRIVNSLRSTISTMFPIPHSDQELSPHELYRGVPREKRILNRGDFVPQQRWNSPLPPKFDSVVAKHFKGHHPTPAPTRRSECLCILTS